jgi:hypothetical protein
MANFLNDTFSGESANTLLQNHTPETGTGWAKITSYGNEGYITSGGVLYSTATTAYRCTATPGSANYMVEATIAQSSSVGGTIGVVARASSSAQTFYRASTDGSTWSIHRINTGTATQVGSSWTHSPAPGTTPYTVAFVIDGDTVELRINDATVIGPTTDGSPISAAGFAGLWLSSSTMTMDEITAGDIAGPTNLKVSTSIYDPEDNTARASQTGLGVWITAEKPGATDTPTVIAYTATGTTNASGLLEVEFAAGTRSAGDIVWLTVVKSDGVPANAGYSVSWPVALVAVA